MKKLHAFVTMPFGKKTGPEGTAIGFNADYKKQLKPSRENADSVVADLPLDNTNGCYESGVRPASRSRGHVPFHGLRATQSFDIYTGRKQNYRLHNGLPKPSTLKKDQATMAFLHDRKITNKIINILAVNACSP